MLSTLSGFVFDLDGCVWNGGMLNPGAGELLAAHGLDLASIARKVGVE